MRLTAYIDRVIARGVTLEGYRRKSLYNDVVKRALDFVCALALLVPMLPVYGVIALAIRLDSPGPVFYRGVRAGYRGGTFRIFKFRSMVADAEKRGGGTTALGDARITRVGQLLRKTKLDETPQLLSIIKGDMSFIGPRPELTRYTDRYQGAEKIILDVRPGISDISSIHFINLDEIVGGENADEIYEKQVLAEKNRLRVIYVLNQSLFFDLCLFLETVIRVFKKAARYLCARGEASNGKGQSG